MPHTTAKPSPRLVQLVREPDSWAFGLKPAQAEQVASWLQTHGFFDPCSAGS